MPTLLVLTIGGSCQPIVAAIQDYQPDFTIFLASSGPRGSRLTVDGAGKPCRGNAGEDDRPNILTQTGLSRGGYTIAELDEPDSLYLCYSKTRATLVEAEKDRQGWRKIADYTGGTKTMTAALALVGLELGWELSLVKGARTNLMKVVDGTEIASLVNTWEVRARQQVAVAQSLFNMHAYFSAGLLLEKLLQVAPLSMEMQHKIQAWVGLCRGFDAWDRFDHPRAAQILEAYQSLVVPQWIFLKKLTGQSKGSGYELVFDLLLNAQRRARRGRYDDAVARLYRALELLAQVCLAKRSPSLSTSALETKLLPPDLKLSYESKQHQEGEAITLGLSEAYNLLRRLGDPLGKIYQENENRFLTVLEKRNTSILAHGLNPIDQETYQKMENLTIDLAQRGLGALGIAWDGVQFPEMHFET